MKRNFASASRAFSLVEMIIVVAILGIISALAVPAFTDILGNSKETLARNVVETLNGATKQFNHSQWDLLYTAKPNDTSDEIYLLRTLQWKESDAGGELNPKGPFMRNDWNPAPSSDAKEFRIEWSGSAWRLLPPGRKGYGLLVVFDGSDLGTVFNHPANFTPAGL